MFSIPYFYMLTCSSQSTKLLEDMFTNIFIKLYPLQQRVSIERSQNIRIVIGAIL